MTTMTREDLAPDLEAAIGRLELFYNTHRSAAENRPAQAEESPAARLFSAYDASEAALDRLWEARSELRKVTQGAEVTQDPKRLPIKLQHDFESDLSGSVSVVIDLLDTFSNLGREPGMTAVVNHIESALRRLHDAEDLMSGQTSPLDNPAPFQGDDPDEYPDDGTSHAHGIA